MDGGKSKGICDLRKVVMVFPDHLPGQIHFHPGEIFDGTIAAPGPEQLLKLGAAYGIASAELLDGQILVDMGLHIFQNLREELSVRLLLDGFDDGRIDRCGADHVPADQLDQKLLQIQPDQLFSGKTGTFRTDQLFLVGIIHPSLKYMSGFLNDLRQKDPFRFADL